MSKVRITVTEPDGKQRRVLSASEKTIRSRLLEFLFGKKAKVVIITPEEAVNTIEIDERRLI